MILIARFICTLILIAISEQYAHSQSDIHIVLAGGAISSEFFLSEPVGYQGEVKLLYSITDTFMISVSSGYYRWNELPGPGESEFQSVPLLAGGRLNVPFGWSTLFLSGELGVHFLTREFISEEYTKSVAGLDSLVSSSYNRESSIPTGFRFGVGIGFAVGEDLSIETAVRYDQMAYNYINNYRNMSSTSDTNLFGVVLGIVFPL